MPRKPYKRHSVTQPLDTSYRYIPLTQGQNAIVDASDYGWLIQWSWHASWNENTQSFYANRRFKRGEAISMHRLILCCSSKEEADHADGDTLNNRRGNLRKCTRKENNRNRGKGRNNTSGYKGVSFDKRTGRWLGQIMVNRKHIHLGIFCNPKDAALAYDVAASKYFGEFAALNFTQ